MVRKMYAGLAVTKAFCGAELQSYLVSIHILFLIIVAARHNSTKVEHKSFWAIGILMFHFFLYFLICDCITLRFTVIAGRERLSPDWLMRY